MRKGKTQIIGCGIVTGGYTREHDADCPAYAHRRPVAWMRDFVAFDLPQYVSDMVLPKHNFPQTLVEITVSQDFLSELAARLLETQTGNVMAYTPILREDITFADKLISTVLASGNVILRGAPGTGKTYLARQAAARIVSGGTAGTFEDLSPDQRQQIGFVQFHPSFDYSDFVEGLRPVL